MQSGEIRDRFLRYFEERGHRVVRSSSLVPASDPTLLFINAGMNQFKDTFLGLEKRDYARAVSSQKCLRVSGKHNDLEQVGRTPRHHTFFEMLGNFSFGDYFKEEAVRFGWELLTEGYGLPVERLWVTVFGGEDDLPADDEAAAIWKDKVGVDPARIGRFGKSENFWSMGDTGPCGPCSEIHWDHGPRTGCRRDTCDPACECGRFVELWNLVFMQFDQTPDGGLQPLPKPNIDTGMGLERITSVIQGVDSNYGTDLFRPLIERVEALSGRKESEGGETAVSMRVIADHLRAMTFLGADGVIPTNDKRGYVLRRLIRRAILHGRRLGLEPPFLHGLVEGVVKKMGGAYPELIESREHVAAMVRREEEQFERTIATGVGMLEQAIERARAGGREVIPGEELFRLYDTYGLPVDLARDIAGQNGLAVDDEGFERQMDRQRERARKSWKGSGPAPDRSVYVSIPGGSETCFVGYGELVIEDARVVALLKDGRPVSRLGKGETGEILLHETPFYAEGGGQVGDRGILAGPHGSATVTDTKSPVPGTIVHEIRVEEGAITRDDLVRAEVDGRRRAGAMRNHTATHLLHAALRDLVGTHLKQAGSLVAPDRLRFDFTHFRGLDPSAVQDVEDLVNEKILENLPIEQETMPLEDALKAGAMALFGEKYGDVVRTIRIGEFSVELCGGTHTDRTGQIGVFKIFGERGISAGVRRVEALTGTGALRRFQEDAGLIREVESLLNTGRPGVVEGLNRKIGAVRDLQKEVDELRMKLARGAGGESEERTVEVGSHRVVARRAEGLSRPEMRNLADTIRQKIGSGVVILGGADDGKASLLVMVTPDLTGRVHAGRLVSEIASHVGGRGGGRPDIAEAGGKEPARLDSALAAGLESAKTLLAGA